MTAYAWKGVPLTERLARRTVKSSGCWTWTGAHTKRGYGVIWHEGRQIGAHRAAYELAKGMIPDGLTIDHLCGNTWCVNPDHLEAVTNRENNMRGNSAPAVNARKTHCINGHQLIPRPDGTGRFCRQCDTDRKRANRAAQRATS